jgi:FRG domain
MDPNYIIAKDSLDYLRQVNDLGRRAWIYRGHSVSCAKATNEKYPKKNYKLVTSVYRFLNDHAGKINKRSMIPRESDHIRRFKSTAKAFLKSYPEDDDVISWLGIMQHFGYPTRLLDFTFNPAIALYFALENSSSKTDYVGVHAIHIDSVRMHTQTLTKIKWSDLEQEDFMIGIKGQTQEFLGIVLGRWSNERQEAQEGVFLVPSKIDMDIENWLRKMPKKKVKQPSNWIKYAVPVKGKDYYARLKELKNIGLAAN